MDRNTAIGLTLIMLLFLVWARINAPSQAELDEQQRIRDSIIHSEQIIEETILEEPIAEVLTADAQDSIGQARLKSQYGDFSSLAGGEEQLYTLENEEVVITFSNRGGRISKVLLKNHNKVVVQEDGSEIKIPLHLMEDEKDRFEYKLRDPKLNRDLSTQDLYFQAEKGRNSIKFSLSLGNRARLEQTYTLTGGEGFGLEYNIEHSGLNAYLPGGKLNLEWVNYLDKIEVNQRYEKNYSSI